MTRIVANGIRLDRIVGTPEHTTIDLLPEGDRDSYIFRAVHIGGLALNLIHGRSFINRERGSREMHVAIDHDTAMIFALNMWARRTDPFQFTEGDAAQFERLSGIEAIGIPGMVLGLSRSDYEPKLGASRFGIGRVLREPVPFSAIDPYSREYLELVLEVNLT